VSSLLADIPDLPHSVPRTHGPLVSAFGRLMMRLTGWRFEGNFPDSPKMMTIVAPHTSNWDVPVGLQAKFALRWEVRFVAKHSLFWWPLGPVLRSLGSVPVNRSAAGDMVDSTIEAFLRADHLCLLITPEGTRKKVNRWKSGFHRIARGAQVPIVLISFDYSRKVVRLGPTFEPTDDYDRDLAAIQSHITASMACVPENYSGGSSSSADSRRSTSSPDSRSNGAS
jgi:1-acyl-sn-glycerol-3-phosphate acyltransferase